MSICLGPIPHGADGKLQLYVQIQVFGHKNRHLCHILCLYKYRIHTFYIKKYFRAIELVGLPSTEEEGARNRAQVYHGDGRTDCLGCYCCLPGPALVLSWSQEPEPGSKGRCSDVGRGCLNQWANCMLPYLYSIDRIRLPTNHKAWIIVLLLLYYTKVLFVGSFLLCLFLLCC